MAVRGAKWSEMCDSGTVVTHTWGTLDLVVFKVIMESFGALLQMACYSKTAGRTARRNEMWDPWAHVNTYIGYL